MKKKLAVLLLAGMLAVTGCVPAFAATVTDFTDVKPTAWYYPAVEYAAEEGLFGGTAPNLFSPEGSMTRGMFVTVLGRKAGINESGYLQYRFEDVQVGDYFAPYVEWAAAYGIVGGTGNNCFEPHAQITREQMAVILYRYAQKTKNDVLFSDEKFQSFPDKDAVSSFAVEAMQWATGKEILNGSAGQLLPQGTATRAQVAQVFYASRDILVKTEITDDPILPPEKPKLVLTPEQEAMLAPNQDPEEIVAIVQENLPNAVWDSSIDGEGVWRAGTLQIGVVDELWNYDSEYIGYNLYMWPKMTGADKYYLTINHDNRFTVVYHIPEKEPSKEWLEVKERLAKELPDCTWNPELVGGGGWAGAFKSGPNDGYTENGIVYTGLDGVVGKCVYYITDAPSDQYYLTEPEPGRFYIFY